MMGLFSSLYTGVSGMNAQSQHTASISTNIANMTTDGYKKTDTVFYDIVVNNMKPAKFAHGGVMTDTINRIDRQGAIQQTANKTDIGIVGQGFFAVKRDDDASDPFLYTRNGSFVPDADGILRNAVGFALYGWPIDENGNVISSPTTAGLELVDVNELNAVHKQTTTAELSLNLDASEPETNPDILSPQQALPLSNTDPDFSRTFNVVDGDGITRNLVFEFRHITGPMASATADTIGIDYLTSLTDPAYFSGINAGDSFTVTVGGTSQEYIIGAAAGAGQVRIDTVGELSNEINSNFGGGNTLDMSLDDYGRIVFRAEDPSASISFTDNVGTPASGSNALSLITQLGNAPLTYTPQTTLIGGAYPDQSNFPTIANTTTPSTRGWWELTILANDPADPDGLTLPPVAVSAGLLSFNSDGSLNAAADADGNIQLALNNINFDNTSTTDTTSLTVDISGFRQFAGAYNVLVQSHNGAEAGTLTDVSVDQEGRVIASFSNSEQFAIYQIPLAVFINPNGLQSITGTVFAETEDSGSAEILEAGRGGAGFLEGSTIERSNVDLADEFANLIVSQRAFSANSRVVNTVDEMTQQLRQLKS